MKNLYRHIPRSVPKISTERNFSGYLLKNMKNADVYIPKMTKHTTGKEHRRLLQLATTISPLLPQSSRCKVSDLLLYYRCSYIRDSNSYKAVPF